MAEEEEAEKELPPYKIEAAKSGRSKCKICRRPIKKDGVRIGYLIHGPFGDGYLWHHLNCSARRQFDRIEEAYELKPWVEGLKVPSLDELRQHVEKSQAKKKEKKLSPWAEKAPTGRSKCKICGEGIAEGEFRVNVLRQVEFGRQIRSGDIKVHLACTSAALVADDSGTPIAGFVEELTTNSGLDAADLAAVLAGIGELPEAPPEDEGGGE